MRARFAAAAALSLVLGVPSSASATDCRRVVVLALPGVTWADVDRHRPANLLAAVRAGAAGSVSVRTILPRSTYASGFATLGAGARVEGGSAVRGRPAEPTTSGNGPGLLRDVVAPGVSEMQALADEAGYGSRPGALADALPDVPVIAFGNSDLGKPPAAPLGYGRWALLPATDAHGVVDLSRTDSSIVDATGGPFGAMLDMNVAGRLLEDALEPSCVVAFVDPGDTARADAAIAGGTATDEDRGAAIAAADLLLGSIIERLDPAHDLFLVVTPTSPISEPQTHLGVAVAVGPGFRAGSALQSASTRRAGIVTLPDVAPTILHALGVTLPPEMNGRPWTAVPGAGDAVRAGVELDRESVFLDTVDNPLSAVYVVAQVLVYAVAVLLIARNRTSRGRLRAIDHAAVAVMTFPLATYLAGALPSHRLGIPGYVAALAALDLILVGLSAVLTARVLDRVLLVTGGTAAVVALDVMTGAKLQINTIFGYSPIVAGRFAGIGNVAYAVLGVAALLAVAVAVEKARGDRRAIWAGAAVLLLVVVVDGAPQWGSDVGGVLSLVPAFGITLLLLAGTRPNVRTLAAVAVVAIVLLGLFLVADLARPPNEQTHLARTWTNVTERGWSSFFQVLERKARANIRVFGSTIWTYFVPPALAALAFLLMKPVGRWEALAREHPRVRAGLIGGLTLGILGFAVNDSGIVIPAVTLSFLVPLAILLHTSALRAAPET